MLWISWPKKAARSPTDLDGNEVRRLGLDAGLVDVKVCAVDETWSALRFKHDPALKTLRENRRRQKRSEAPTLNLKQSDLKKTRKLRRDQEDPPPKRKRRREAATVSLRGPGMKNKGPTPTPERTKRERPACRSMASERSVACLSATSPSSTRPRAEREPTRTPGKSDFENEKRSTTMPASSRAASGGSSGPRKRKSSSKPSSQWS